VILCFGDSLTAGFQSPTSEHPTGQETPMVVSCRNGWDPLSRFASVEFVEN
jgi:lysophospholipase L1-like esterase